MTVNGSSAKGRSTIALILGSLLAAGCAGSGHTAPPTAAPAATPTQAPTSAPAVTPTSPASPTLTPTPTPVTVTAELDVSFESANPLNPPGILNVFAPVRPGRWPVVVMFHGNPDAVSREYLSVHARRVADAGFVVFVPNWGKRGGAAYDALSVVGEVNADAAQAACAVAFARARAADYGGDPARMIVFGHSGGGNIASVVAFARPAPTGDCRGGTKLGAIDTLIAWEGDWVLAPPFWDSILADEPGVLDALTPWKHLADRRDLPVHFVVSDNPGLGRADGAWLEDRDPSGAFRRLFEVIGALDDGYLGLEEMQAMFARALEDQGNAVTYEVMPGSTHESISPEGWKVFLDAFKRAATAGG